MPTSSKIQPIKPKNASLEQAALHIAAQMARGMRPGGKNGADYQIYVDFFESIRARADEERRRDANNRSRAEDIPENNRLKQSEQSLSRGRLVGKLYERRSGLDIRFKGLAGDLLPPPRARR